MTPPYFLHQALAQDFNERLSIVRAIPQHILLVGADADISRQLLAQRYPKAQFSEYDHRPEWLQHAHAQRHTSLFAKLTGKTIAQHQQALTDPLPHAQADMLWANLALMHADAIVPVLENWANVLKANGLLFFSHLGVDSFSEIRALLATHGITCSAPTFVDMHDLGDMLFHHGFYDPVIDTAKVVLTYEQAETFWHDVDNLGLWTALRPSDDAQARAIVDKAWRIGELSQITLETVFGHAIRQHQLAENEQLVQFYPQRK